MITGQPLNHLDKLLSQFIVNISQYKIFIKDKPLKNFLETLNANETDDFKRKIISGTLCNEKDREKCPELIAVTAHFEPRLQVGSVSSIQKQTLIRDGEKDPDIFGMRYISAREQLLFLTDIRHKSRDELFFADFANGVVRSIRMRDNIGDLNDVYKAPHDTSPFVWSACHMSDSNALLVCSGERGPDQKVVNWLVVLSRNGNEWRETHRLQTEQKGCISCALSDSRVLIGECNSSYIELFRVESGPRIARLHRIHVPEEYKWFSATCGSETLVAMSYSNLLSPKSDNSVRVHRLRGDRLEELFCVRFKCPDRVMWLADKSLLVADTNTDKRLESDTVVLLSGTRLERRRELIASSENIRVRSWCLVDYSLAIFDSNTKSIQHYPFV